MYEFILVHKNIEIHAVFNNTYFPQAFWDSYKYTKGYYSAIKNNEVLSFEATWDILEDSISEL